MNRAFSTLTIKSIDPEKRIIRGVATTPEPDRMGDIVQPLGVQFKNPMPLLHQHDSSAPVGQVRFDKPTKDGITFTAELPTIDEPGQLKDRIDLAWQELKAGLVRFVSIGFRSLKHAFLEDGGVEFQESEVLELSLVTIPANAGATITAIKSIDSTLRAAAGIQDGVDRPVRPGASGQRRKSISLIEPPKEGNKMNLKEQIAALKKKRDDAKARMMEIQKGASDAGRTKDESEQEEFGQCRDTVASCELELKDLEDLEAMNVSSAAAVAGASAAAAASSRENGNRRSFEILTPKLEKGIGFIRMVSALAEAKGNRQEAAAIAVCRWKDSSPQIADILRMPLEVITRTAVNPGTTSDTTWAAPLVQYSNLASEFIEYLRPLTIIGQIQGFRKIPFKTKVPRQTGGASVNWVGENRVKPLSSLAFDSVTLDFAKVAGIIPLSEELVRLSSPSAEALVRDDLAKAIAQFLDSQFLDPTKAADDVSPASVLYGISPTAPTGVDSDAWDTDVKTMFGTLLTANQQIDGGVFIMTQAQALGFSLMKNALGQYVHPNITIKGGTFMGFPAIVSQNIAAAGGSPTDGYPIIFLLAGEVLMADDGQVVIDVSREASLQMETTPDSPFTASTVTVNLWQNNLIAIKAERWMNWKVRRASAAAFIQGGKYA